MSVFCCSINNLTQAFVYLVAGAVLVVVNMHSAISKTHVGPKLIVLQWIISNTHIHTSLCDGNSCDTTLLKIQSGYFHSKYHSLILNWTPALKHNLSTAEQLSPLYVLMLTNTLNHGESHCTNEF